MVEPYKPYIEGILRSESWRAGPGDLKSLCPGDLSYDGTRHWLCTGCGRIGLLPTTRHFVLKAPSLLMRFAHALVTTPVAPL